VEIEMSVYMPIAEDEKRNLVGIRLQMGEYSAPKHFCATCRKEIKPGEKAIFTGDKSYHDNGKCFKPIVPPTRPR